MIPSFCRQTIYFCGCLLEQLIKLVLILKNKNTFVLSHSYKRNLTDHIVLKIGNKKIKQETHFCFLGVPLDSTLTSEDWHEQLACFIKLDIVLHKIHCCACIMLFLYLVFAYAVSVCGLKKVINTHPLHA